MHCRHTHEKISQLWATFLGGLFLRPARQTITQGGDEVLRIFNLKSFSPSSLILQKNWKHVEQHGWYAHLLGKPWVNSSSGAHQGYPPFQPCNFDVLSPNCLKIENILNKVLGMPLSQASARNSDSARVWGESPYIQPRKLGAASLNFQRTRNQMDKPFGILVSWASLEIIDRLGPAKNLQDSSLYF